MPNVCLYPDKDTSIDRAKPTTNYGGDNWDWVTAAYISGVKSQNYRALMHWTIPPEISSAEVYKAILCLGGLDAFAAAEAKVYRITQPAWTEMGATWNKYDGVTNWATMGGDYDAAMYVTFTFPAAWKDWFEIDITTLVMDAITNRGRSLDLLFRLSNEDPGSNIQFSWWSREIISPWTPFLNIVRPPFGLPMEV
jgi:hypothetical protein